MTFQPHLTVAAIIENKGKFLMVEELIDGKICFNQPAGHLEASETLAEACVREVSEETAHVFAPDFLVGVYHFFNPQTKATFMRFCFAGKMGDFNENQALDKEIIKTHWLSFNEIKAREQNLRSPLVLACLQDYLAGKNYPLSFISTHF